MTGKEVDWQDHVDHMAGLPLFEVVRDRARWGGLRAHEVNWNRGETMRWPQRPSAFNTAVELAP